MKDQPLDPRHQMLIAALYEELDPDAMERFRALLETDPDLRTEWEELREARSLLVLPDEAEESPGFVFLKPPRARLRPAGLLGRLVPIRITPAWGFAGLAAGLAVLLAAGLRVDWTDGGVAFRFGGGPVLVTERYLPPAADPSGALPSGALPDGASWDASPTRDTSPSVAEEIRLERASQATDPVTRDDLNLYSAAILKAMAQTMGESQLRQKRELAYIMERFYDDLLQEQDRRYDDLKARVDGVGLGLLAEQNRTNARLTRLIEGPQPANPGDRDAGPATPREPQEVEKP